MQKLLSQVSTALLDTILPMSCIGCGTLLKKDHRRALCARCIARAQRLQESRCPLCRKRLPQGKVDQPCRAKSGLAYFAAAGSYENPMLKAAILAMKYKFLPGIADPLGEMLAATLSSIFSKEPLMQISLVMPIPLHKKRLRWRGFNQAERIAAALARNLRLPPPLRVWGDDAVFMKIRENKQQASLTIAERVKNVKGVFAVRRPESISGKRILLIDDVLASGATMYEAARTLRNAGAKEVWGAAVARAD